MIEALDSLGDEPKHQMLYMMLQKESKKKTVHLDFYEFLDMITSRVSSKDTRRDMNKVFSMLDEDKTGTISINTLKSIVKDFSEGIDET